MENGDKYKTMRVWNINILGKQTVRKKSGAGSCSIGGFGTTGVEI
jgi:hypothetical protein